MNDSNDTKTFITSDGRFKITIFAKFYGDYLVNDYDFINLFQDLKIHERGWLHNPRGPAIINLQTHDEIYWINGELAKEEDINRIRAYRNVDVAMKKLFDDED